MKELPEILKVLYDAHLEFVVIGGAAMHLQGSAYVTKDVDFCCARTPQNIKRLVGAIAPYHPSLRGVPADLPFTFDARTVSRNELYTVDGSWTFGLSRKSQRIGPYESVKSEADVRIINGMEIAVLSLIGLIKSKKAAGRAKDLYVLPELEAVEQLKRKTGAE